MPVYICIDTLSFTKYFRIYLNVSTVFNDIFDNTFDLTIWLKFKLNTHAKPTQSIQYEILNELPTLNITLYYMAY